jgi:choline dehydrogenase-like flavoprotein
MGADASAAVGPTGESHDVPGLWVADASLMPTSLKVNPMITVMACARHVAGELAGRLS